MKQRKLGRGGPTVDVNLTSDDLARIAAAAPHEAVAGARYPDSAMAMVNR